jgi:hypothetical protein
MEMVQKRGVFERREGSPWLVLRLGAGEGENREPTVVDLKFNGIKGQSELAGW